eukprot:GSChrysophyteH1.ASY1.ANO1.915.1 assembled CDS
MSVRYSNDKSVAIRELEEKQGSTYLPGDIYIHTDKKGFKRLYILNTVQRIFMFFEDPKFSKLGNLFGSFMMIVIVFNLIVFIISSLDNFKYRPEKCTNPVCNNDPVLCPNKMICEPIPQQWTRYAETFCVTIFSIDYLARVLLVWSIPPRLANVLIKPKKKEQNLSALFTSNKPSAKDELFAHIKLALSETEHESHKLIRTSHRYTWYFKTYSYVTKRLNIIDLIAVLPFFIEAAVDHDNSTQLSIIRVLRLARVFRIFKMGKGNAGVQMLGRTIFVSMPALSLLSFFIFLGVILFGALIYFIEGGEFTVDNQFRSGAYVIEDFFGTAAATSYTSIVSAIYWAVVVTTTTGYGDMVPYSFAGKLVAILCAYYGFLLLALPITVIGNNFDKILNAQQGRDNEQFIFECLIGIIRSIDTEYRARAKMAPVPSNAYKNALVTAIISTFDSTKQTLLKDSILAANRAANTRRRLEAQRLSKAASNPSPNPSPKHKQDDSNEESEKKRRFISWAGEDEEESDGELDDESDIMTEVNEEKPAGIFTHSHTMEKMAGISWERMPMLSDDKHNVPHTGLRTGLNAQEELNLAAKELQEATAEWIELFRHETIHGLSSDSGKATPVSTGTPNQRT